MFLAAYDSSNVICVCRLLEPKPRMHCFGLSLHHREGIRCQGAAGNGLIGAKYILCFCLTPLYT